MPLDRDFPAIAASLATIRRAVGAYAATTDASASIAASAVQAVHEAAANAVVHGYRGGDEAQAVSVHAADDEGWLRLTVSDSGEGFRPSRTSPGYGLGLAIIAQLADEFEIRDAVGGGLVVRIAFRLTG